MPVSSLTPRELARALGGDALRDGVLAPGPGHGPRDRSLRVWLDPEAPDSFRTHSFAGDDPLLCRDHVRERLLLPEFRPGSRSSAPLRRRPTRPTVEPSTGQQALAIWRDAVSPRGTIAETYLKSRGLELDAAVIGAVRFHHSLYFKPDTRSGIIALFRDVLTDEACGIHRTFLHKDGRPILDGAGKKIRRMLGRAKSAAIKIDADDAVTLGLHIGEGVETCLAARQLGYRPVWALGSADAIATFPVLPGIEAITVFAENDDASNRAAEACCARYEDAGLEAWICEPPSGDMNTIIQRSAA